MHTLAHDVAILSSSFVSLETRSRSLLCCSYMLFRDEEKYERTLRVEISHFRGKKFFSSVRARTRAPLQISFNSHFEIVSGNLLLLSSAFVHCFYCCHCWLNVQYNFIIISVFSFSLSLFRLSPSVGNISLRKEISDQDWRDRPSSSVYLDNRITII